jgi:hypothetical protein
MPPLGFSPRQIDWIENRRATHAHRVVPGMRNKSSGNAPARGVKSRCGFHILQQKVRFTASPQVVAVDLRRRNFASSGSIAETAALSLLGGSITAPRRFGTSRLGVSGKPGVRGVTP